MTINQLQFKPALRILLPALGLLMACQATGPKNSRLPAALPPVPVYAYRLLPAAQATFGYEISRQGAPLLRQLTVPGRTGQAGFASAAQAGQVATLVIGKLRTRHWPPTVSATELDSLGIL